MIVIINCTKKRNKKQLHSNSTFCNLNKTKEDIKQEFLEIVIVHCVI